MVEWRYSSTILDLGTSLEVGGQLHALTAVHPGIEPPVTSTVTDITK
jgi:hypothetical protein